jgi:hyperosmotically inducible protein
MKKLVTMVVAVLAIGSMAACAPTRTTRSAGEGIDDAALTAKVKTAITKEHASNAVKVDVETYRGDVQLNGFVNSAETKADAARIAKSVAGVKSVSNNLKVSTSEQTAGGAVDDTIITAKVKTALASDPDVAAHEVNVETRAGVVQLAGFVDDSSQKSKAAEVTRRVAGVKQVDNQLEVKQR